MWAAAIFWRVRVSRLAIAASETSSARATSAVLRPHSVRSASATWASGARRRVAAREEQPQQVVVDGGRGRLRLLVECSQRVAHGLLLLRSAGGLTAHQVDGAAARRQPQPGHRVGRHAVARPVLEGAHRRVLDGVLGQPQVAGPPRQGGQDVAPGRADQPVQLGAGVVVRGVVEARDGGQEPKSMTGRTSTRPPFQAAGIFAAQRDRLVEVGALELVEAGERLLGLGVRPVGGDRVAALLGDVDRGGGGRRVERGAAADDGGGGLAELGPLAHLVGVLGRGPVDVLGVGEGAYCGMAILLGVDAGACRRLSPVETNGVEPAGQPVDN